MQRLKALGLVSMAVLAVSIAVVATASADELPQFSVETGFEGKFGASTVNLTGAAISTPKGEFTGTATSKRLGGLTIQYLENVLGGKECHSEGDAAGVVLVKGEWHVVPTPGSATAPLVAILVPKANRVHITCLFLNILILLEGCLLGKIAPAGKDTTAYTLKIAAPGKKQELLKFLNDEGKEVLCNLNAQVGTGAETEEISQEINEISLTTLKLTEIQPK
jgi:hypothetical protein